MDGYDDRLRDEVARQPYPLLFVTVSGAHLYGFPSPDSDYDLRGAHILPLREVVGLDIGRDTIEVSEVRDGLEVDLVTHDVRKFCGPLLKKNGYVLEQLYSPLVVHSTSGHEELKRIATGCVTRHHSHHYFGFAETQWRLFEKERPRRVKPLLYVYRVLLTGIHLTRTGAVEANLVHLNDEYQLPYISDLIARKLAGAEQSTLEDVDVAFYHGEYGRLRGMLEDAFQKSALPDAPSTPTRAALNDLLIQLRLQSFDTDSAAPAATTCPVCGLDQAFVEPGGYGICARCGWEDAPTQRHEPDAGGGANNMSLREARTAWRAGLAIQ